MTESLEHCLGQLRPRFESILRDKLAAQRQLPELHTIQQALEHSCLQGGKRLRAILVYLGAYACGAELPAVNSAADALDSAAAAIEVMHCYSLIHDDLPAMDDDALRRGQPTCHILFGEANAILAGDALQALAFEWLATAQLDAPARVKLVALLARSAGIQGMVGGQAIDLAAVDQNLALEQLVTMHRLKTGALFEAAAAMGAICAAASEAQQAALHRFASAMGLAFQVQDDIIDIDGDPAETGKPRGADIAANKPTFPALLGLAEARTYAERTRNAAIEALQPLGARAEPLRQLADFVVERRA
ncbi:MAG: polyprenyl synthetase family protein [Pseudomonadales bacterium]|nr:polyprenyl synthetase family protein [Pseudomonadales bacterium]